MPRKFHGLKRPKVRQDWSKWTLYNISRMAVPPAARQTFFQQKWYAKSMTRAYHNPYVREGTWTRMFDRRLPAVVPMDYRYLARQDGSELARGRGSGVETDPSSRSGRDDNSEERGKGSSASAVQKTPYMHMAYHPLERRLDTAIWRALFASSTKQARQFVVHGSVKVNGKKMIYPGYLLNPGDMFSVDPERVMYATGARKANKDGTRSPQRLHMKFPKPTQGRNRRQETEMENDEAAEEEDVSNESSEAGAATIETAEERALMEKMPHEMDDPRKAMKSLMVRAKKILDDGKKKLSARRQQELRTFAKSVRLTMNRHGKKTETVGENTNRPIEDSIDSLQEVLDEITSKIPDTLSLSGEDKKQEAFPTPEKAEVQPDGPAKPNPQLNTTSTNKQMADGREDAYKARKDAELLHAALARAQENPRDVRKPYATPWMPREYMTAFAFIPRYLEVNQNICSAVYLRHPVARPGLAEVPSPFHAETMELAFNWYLRRR